MEFYKLVATGNDFILLDGRAGSVPTEGLDKLAQKLCRRRFSIGADGLIVIRDSKDCDFSWEFFNPDGSRAEMCGNGARCAARLYNYLTGKREMTFLTGAGKIKASVDGSFVRVDMGEYRDLRLDMEIDTSLGTIKGHFVNTGVPHFVVQVSGIDDVDVVSLGREIRFHEAFQPSGTNVDFFEETAEGTIAIRTYERGVEGETLACGTGACAVAVVAERLGLSGGSVTIKTKGGELKIELKGSLMTLGGEARFVYKGKLFKEEQDV